MRHVIDDVLITLPSSRATARSRTRSRSASGWGWRAAYLADVFQSSLGRPSYEQTGRFPVVRMHVVKRRSPDAGEAPPWIWSAARRARPGGARDADRRHRDQDVRAGTRDLQPAALRAEQAAVRDVQVPHDGRRREALQADLETRNEASGPVFKIRHDPGSRGSAVCSGGMSLDEATAVVQRPYVATCHWWDRGRCPCATSTSSPSRGLCGGSASRRA